MPNCVDLNLNIYPLKEGIDINSYGTADHTRIPMADVNDELISIIKKLNLTLNFVELFYTKSFALSKIHVDNIYIGDYTKINYIFGGKNSLMYWWEPKPNILNLPKRTMIGSPYIDYKITEVNLIDEQQVKFPSIVQVGIPHNIKNFEEPRYCLSLVLIKQDDTRLTMAESIEIFKQYL